MNSTPSGTPVGRAFCGCLATLRTIGRLLSAGSARQSSVPPARSGDRTNIKPAGTRRVSEVVFSSLASLAMLAAFVAAPQLQAESNYVGIWQGIYPDSTSETQAGRGSGCRLCHTNSNNEWNGYGNEINQLGGNIGTRITAVQNNASVNINGSTSYLTEIDANAQPGWTTGVNSPVYNNGGTQTNTIDAASLGVQPPMDPAAANNPPVANNDSYSTDFQTQLVIAAPGVLGNDTDADGDTLTAVLQSGPTSGTLNLNANGSFIYTPAAGFSGDASFTYVANDGTDDSNVATVTIAVGAAPNNPPVANNDSYSTAFETQLTIAAPGVLGNDTDADGDPLTAVLQSGPTSGTLNLNANGSFTYTPATGFSGTATFTYVANDGTDDSNPATVAITVGTPANVPPVANNDSYITPFQTQLVIAAPGVLGNDTDADGDPLTAVLQSGPTSGTLNLNANGSFTYTPAAGFSGDATFTYVANDGTDNSNVATVTITVGAAANTPPVANNDSYSTPFETQLTVAAPGVLGNDTDVDGDPLTAALQSDPTSGTLVLNADGSFTYTPNTGFSGVDSFTYLANDGTDNSNVATVSITVSPAPGGDADNDGVPDNLDNCIDASNGPNTPPSTDPTIDLNQRDTNGDGYGNVCDADFNNNGKVDPTDFTAIKALVGQVSPDHDLNGNGIVDPTDFTFTKANLGQDPGPSCVDLPVPCVVGDGLPTARGDTYATAVGKTLTVQLSRVSGVLYNDFDTDAAGNNLGNDGLTAQLISGPTNAAPGPDGFSFNTDGSFVYTPNATLADNSNDSFTYQALDAESNPSEVVTVNIHVLSDQPDFKIMMNYELGMHCTGFEFSYCCVLPPYNSILTQVVKPQPQQGRPQSNADFARLLEGDPNNGLDGLGRETVVRDYDNDGNFFKYYLEYFHDAQPRREGNMPGTFNNQTSTLISDIEGNSMLYHNTPYDSALVDTDGSITGVPGKLVRAGDLGIDYAGFTQTVVGNGDYTDATDSYSNGWLNHFYIYQDLEGSNPNNSTLEADKIRLGVTGHVEYPANVGAALQPMGPVSTTPVPFDNVLTFSADTGTVVFTQSKVLENLPIMLTSPRIWEALGLPLTPFEDSINFFGEPGAVDEDSIRPYVAMKAQLYEANCDTTTGACTQGGAVLGSNQQPVIGHGTAPIDIPNCERCHSVPAYQADGVTPNVNSPSYVRRQGGPDPFFGPNGETLQAITDLEINYWMSVYPSLVTGSDWYARLKGAAINMLALHDFDTGTTFSANYPSTGNPLGLPPEKAAIPQNTRLGFESVICQKCHGDNVIAAVNPLGPDAGFFLPPISEAIHNTHRNQSEGGVIVFNDGLGRDGGCQGCHPAHRSDGVMDNYPITIAGDNANAGGDNRLNQGGCFVGRDVHSNPLKDVDGAETPEHLNAVGQWLVDNVATGQAGELGGTEDNRGIWCTNCHSQLGQEIWAAEDCNDLIHNDCLVNPRAEPTLAAVAAAVGLTEDEAIDFLDPKVDGFNIASDQTHAVWNPAIPDADAATIEVGPGGPVGTTDADGDFSVNILSFCTTQDCVDGINANKGNEGAWRYPEGGTVDGTAGFISTANTAVPVPFSAATDGRDHWLAGGEPHCADCHAAPYTEQSGNINPFPPFNYPAKAGLMRYSRGHQDLSCQGCHESIHGLYPVSAAIDTTSYAQAAALNADGSHGPLKCGACHKVNGQGIPAWHGDNNDGPFQFGNFDEAVGFAHTFTDEADPLDSLCQNCHGDERDGIRANDDEYVEHAMVGRTSRLMMDKAEISQVGHVLGAEPGPERNQLCAACHAQQLGNVTCDSEWREHLSQGRVAESVWLDVTDTELGTPNPDDPPETCGW